MNCIYQEGWYNKKQETCEVLRMKAKKGRGLLRYLDGFWRQSILAPLFKLLEAPGSCYR